VVATLLVPAVTAPAPAEASALSGRLARELASGGGATSALAVDLATGRTLLSVAPDVARSPASVEKLYTMSTALKRFGLRGTLPTTALSDAVIAPDGTLAGDLYLRGGGDPTFGDQSFDRANYGTGATVQALVRRLRTAGLRRVFGRVVGDESLFDSLRGTIDSRFGVDPYIGPLSAADFDRGLADLNGNSFQARPPLFAADALRTALERAGIRVTGRSSAGPTPPGATPLGSVSSPPMSTIAGLTLRASDNFMAEMTLKDLGARFGGAGSTAAGAAVVGHQLHGFGISARVLDGSGLTRADHTSPRALIGLLGAVRVDPIGRTLRAALPAAGRTGTLAHRMVATAADGRCQAKTGTLSDVSTLAGYCRGARSGDDIAFALLFNHCDPSSAHDAQDAVVEDLARSS